MTFDKQLWGGIFMLFVAVGCFVNQFVLGHHGTYNFIGMGIGLFAGIGLIRNHNNFQ